MRANHSAKLWDGWHGSLRRLGRFRIRTLLLIIAILGSLGCVWIERDNRWHRNDNARIEQHCIEEVARHAREAMVCRTALGAGKPYDLNRSRNYYVGDWYGARSWGDELGYHDECVRQFRERTAEASRRRQYYQSRLLWPF